MQLDAPDPLGRVPYHLGVATCDLAAAMEQLGRMFGFSWGPVATSVEPGLANPHEPVEWTCSRAHSLGGPFHLELLEGSAGSIWACDELAATHHLAYWSDDVAGEIAELTQQGWMLEATLRDGHGRPTEFGYLSRPEQIRIELVGSHRRDSYLSVTEPPDGGR